MTSIEKKMLPGLSRGNRRIRGQAPIDRQRSDEGMDHLDFKHHFARRFVLVAIDGS